MSDQTDDRQTLAMSYLLGQATPQEVREVQRLLETDRAFADLMTELETWLSPLNELTEERTPPVDLLDDILEAIDEEERSQSVPATVVTSPGLWRPAAIAASFIAAIATGLHFLPEQTVPPANDETIMALLSPDAETSLVVIVYDPEANRVVAQLSNADLPADGVWQLWLIPEGESTPQSLGLLTRQVEDGVELELDRQLRSSADTLAISVEPVGGSPEPGPTGPVVFSGKVGSIKSL